MNSSTKNFLWMFVAFLAIAWLAATLLDKGFSNRREYHLAKERYDRLLAECQAEYPKWRCEIDLEKIRPRNAP